MASSSSSHALVPVTKYDLFISFRGAEIRDNFLSHLLQELRLNQIDVYVDERLQRGDEISPTLLQAIEESSISLVIFSKDYASSKWCMEELVKIIECKEQHHRIVIPVFYKIDPSHVRHLRGPFEEAFGKHQERYKGNMVMVQSWRSALKTAADLSGFHYPSKYKDERELIEEIVEDVSDRLCNNLPSETRDDLVGIDEHLKLIEPLLAIESSEVRILGIWGMGGIGKTTIAKFVFDKYSSKYDGRCFLDNVREESQKHGGLTHLFQKLVSELLQDEKILLQGLSATRLNNVKRRLGKMKVFMVLDDVSSSEQLEHLFRKQIPLGQGSRVIITTREKQILRREHQIYEVKKLNFKNSLMLFCLNAFGKNYPEIGYENQSKSVVGYTNGVPLALKVLGSFLHSIDNIKAWNDELGKLKSDPNKEVFNALKLSYDGLDDKEKDIFLDIAFFFKGKDKDYVIRLLNSCGFRATIGIDSLLRKALISLSEDNKIEMHDLIEQMGWEIVRQEFIKDPGKRSRLRDPDDVYDVLKYNKGTNIIEGIVWDLSKTLNNRDLHLQVDTFKKMPKLRVLIAYGMPSNVHIPAELETFSDEMRYLEWMRYPLTSLPSSFCAEMLVEFSMPFSEVTKLWDGVQDLVNLEKINLWRCMQLEELPDFSKASKLREIDLTYCLSLRRVHPSILRTPTLEVLKLPCCKELKSLESEFQFEHLHELDVGCCSSLEQFSVKSEKIRSLDLRGSNIEELNPSIIDLSELERFYLSSMRITRLPDVLFSIRSLVELDLSGCKYIIELPPNIRGLTQLTTLGIRGCFILESLLELPSSLTRLDATDCTSLKTVSGVKAVSSFKWTWFSLQNCNSLDEPSRDLFKEAVCGTMRRRAVANFRSKLASDDVSGICYPGSKVPEWFKYRTRGASVSVELDQPADQFLGFFLCCVTSPLPYIFKDCYQIKSQCYLGDGEGGRFEITWRCLGVNQGLKSDHVYTWFDNENNDKQILVDEIKKYRTNDHCTTNSQKISLEFVIIRQDGNDEENVITLSDAVIKETGVHPIYSQDIRDESERIRIFSRLTKGLVGIDEQIIECIESLLDVHSLEVKRLGIWGISGIGKTTVTKVIFDKWSSQYDRCCFLENVAEESLKHGLPYLSRKLVSEILQGEKNYSRRLQSTSRKVFIVLDNVNSTEHLKRLIEAINLGPGSRVIVTTRDKQTLELVHGEYEVQGLNTENSLELFCLNAFSKPYPKTRYAMESEMAVSYAKGVPLVLKALASFLASRDMETWGSELRKLELHPNTDIFDVLKLCYDYDGLDDAERNIFLDIAFFFKGRKKDDVISLLDSCGFNATSRIDNLIRKALIYISEDNKTEMHDLFQQMGWKVVRQESIEDPGKRSRLRNREDVYDVLRNNRGTDSIEVIMLDLTDKIRREQIHLHADTFKRMPKLRILQIVDNNDRILNSGELESLSNELRYLEWKGCPLRSLPSSFCPKKLVELRMPLSIQLTKLWDGVQDLVNLEIIDLQGCWQLVELPDFSKASKLREIILSGCSNLCCVHPSILCIPTLEVLRLDRCIKLISLVGKIHFEYLHDLQVTGCKSLQEFSVTSKEIRSLDLRGTDIDVLHSSIGRLSKLETFYLGYLRIKCLPDELSLLTSLVELDLSGCSEIIELPGNIKALTRLTTLLIRDCERLQNIPELPSSMARLDADNCTSLQTVRSIRAVSSINWRMFSFQNCLRLLDYHSVNDLMEAAHDSVMRHAIDNCLNLLETYVPKGLKHDDECDVCYPGSEVPEWFRYQTRKASSINLEFDQHGDQLLGFLLCCVISLDALRSKYYVKLCYIDIHCYLGDGERDHFEIKLRVFWKDFVLSSDTILIWCDHENKLLDGINQYRVNALYTNSQTISVEFVIRVRSVLELSNQVCTDQVVKGWGISPIYVSDIHNFIGKKDKEMEFDDKYKEYRQLVLSKLNQLRR